MPPAIVHRHTFSFREAMAALLDEDQVDADSYEIRVVGNALVVDLVNPRETTRIVEKAIDEVVAEHGPVEDAPRLVAEKVEQEFVAGGDPVGTGFLDAAIDDDSPFNLDPPREPGPDPEPEKPKGGKLAQMAGILCQEKAFWVFMEESSAEGAAAALRNTCGVESRSELDHNEAAGREFRSLKAEYEAWCRQ